MGWANTWDDILQGGSPRWKVTDSNSHQIALSHMQRYIQQQQEEGSKKTTKKVLCPLAGDDPMVYLLWQQGYSVTAMDLVPAALEEMRNQFPIGTTWTREEYSEGGKKMVIWKHDSGRATQYEGDALQYIEELKSSFDIVYDKDSFGALSKEMRNTFCTRIGQYTKADATLYIEVKLRQNHEESKDVGPPFSLKAEDLIEYYGPDFDYVEGLGSVYPISFPGVQQTAHILKRK